MDQEDEIDPRYELRLGAGRSLPEAIADKIREFVDNGTFKPGTKLPNESELARNMRVARSSVRTALQRLEAHGVCDVKRGVGWYVRRVPVQATDGAAGLLAGKRYAVADLFEVRIGLEGLAASLAAVRATPGEIDDIAKLQRSSISTRETTRTSCCARTSHSMRPSCGRAATTCSSKPISRSSAS